MQENYLPEDHLLYQTKLGKDVFYNCKLEISHL